MDAESEAFAAAVDQLLAVWNDRDASQRRERLEAVWGPSSVFSEPGLELTGVEPLLDYLDQLHKVDSGYRIRRTSQIFVDHGQCSFTWRGDTSSGLRLQGTAHGMVSDDGQIATLRRAMTQADRVVSLEGRHPAASEPNAGSPQGS